MNLQTYFDENNEKSMLSINQCFSRYVDLNLLHDILNGKAKSFSNKNTKFFFEVFSKIQKSIKKTDCLIDDTVCIKFPNSVEYDELIGFFAKLGPWRKGPFQLLDVVIDSEWQSFMKWNRFKPHWDLINNKTVLDIGCGNGYYMFRMLNHHPKFVLGIDPSHLTYFQYHSIQHFINDTRLSYLPIGWADLHPFSKCFDVVFCMGILYHNRSPIDVLITAKSVLKKNGKLFLDTLIIPGEDDISLLPKDRYAGMPNVYFLPTVNCLKNMLMCAGFKHVDVLSIDQTTEEEQRPTKWSTPVSFAHYLDPNDKNKTVEGYPAPCRVAMLCY